jgi:hypothetical protein
VENWYIFSRFGIFYEEKSGNPVSDIELDKFTSVQQSLDVMLNTCSAGEKG